MYNLTPKPMAKIYGLFGAMTGKVADAVMSVRNGEQIVRKYQPVVSNPNTPAQVEARAKLKLMSQLSAVMAPVIAIPRVGSVSSRNLFTKKNYPLTTYASSEADINLADIQLTDSVVGLPGVSVSRTETALVVGLNDIVPAGTLDEVVYCLFTIGEDGKVRLFETKIEDEAGAGAWSTEMTLSNARLAVYAYGIRFNTEAARARYSNLEVKSAADIAHLIVTRTVTAADITVTETQGRVLAAAQA